MVHRDPVTGRFVKATQITTSIAGSVVVSREFYERETAAVITLEQAIHQSSVRAARRTYFDTVPSHVKSSRRAKNKAARKSRKTNR